MIRRRRNGVPFCETVPDVNLQFLRRVELRSWNDGVTFNLMHIDVIM